MLKYNMTLHVSYSRFSLEKKVSNIEVALTGKMYTIRDKFRRKNVMNLGVISFYI